MSKLCKACGLKHRNSALKYASCKTPFNDQKQRAKKRRLIILTIAVAVLITTAVFAILHYSGPKGVTRRVMDAYRENDPESLVDTLPPFYVNADGSNREKMIQQYAPFVKRLSNYIFSYYLDEPLVPSERQREELMKQIRYFAGADFKESDIEDIRFVWVHFTGDVLYIWPKYTERFIVIKYEGDWYWWPDSSDS